MGPRGSVPPGRPADGCAEGKLGALPANSHPSLTRLLGVSSPQHIRLLRATSGRVAAREMDSRACARTHGDCCHPDSGVGQRAKRQATNSILHPALVRREILKQ